MSSIGIGEKVNKSLGNIEIVKNPKREANGVKKR
jgi:hypothetical protein